MANLRRTAVVTGAAGGVGRAVVEALTGQGYDVVATDIDASVETLARSTSEGTVSPVVADIRSTVTAATVVERAQSVFGRLDLLVNNAGRFLRKPISDTTDQDFDELFAINARAAFAFVRAALPLLRDSRGSIVNVASTSGLAGVSGQVVYAMTKGAIVQLTRQQAIEQADHGVRVNAVAPGAIDTEFTAEANADEADPAATLAKSLARHPIGRYSTPQEVAAAVVFLASEAASGITGSILSVDGGYVAQ